MKARKSDKEIFKNVFLDMFRIHIASINTGEMGHPRYKVVLSTSLAKEYKKVLEDKIDKLVLSHITKDEIESIAQGNGVIKNIGMTLHLQSEAKILADEYLDERMQIHSRKYRIVHSIKKFLK